MAINVGAANSQASQLSSNVSQLRNAKNQLVTYRSTITSNWQGAEVGYIVSAINQLIDEIDGAIRNLDSIGGDIRQTAEQIRREEEAAAAAAAAARARAEKQRRIQAAQQKYNEARDELDKLNEEMEKLEKKHKKASGIKKFKYALEIEELKEKIEKAEEKCSDTHRALVNAKR